jgi:hypothetical protein
MPVIRYEFMSVGAERVKEDLAAIAARGQMAEKAQRTRKTSTQGDREAKATEREAQRAARATERAEQEKTRAVERESKRRARLAEREAIEVARTAERARRDQARAHQTAANRYRSAGRLRSAVESSTAKGTFVGSLAASATSAGVGGLLQLGGSAVRDRLDNEDRALKLAIAGRQAGQAQIDHRALLEDAERSARMVKGTKAGDILDAQSQFVSMTGDLGQARELGSTFALAGKATGSDPTNIAATAATLREKFKIKDAKEMREALGALVFQGKSGAFEMKDMARYATEMGAAGERFGLPSGSKGVKQLGTLAQLARMSTGSGAEASTGVQAMLRQLIAKSDDIQRVTGAKVFTDKSKTTTNDVFETLVETISGAKGNQQTLQKLFGDEGMKGVSKMVSTFNDAARAAGANATEQQRLAAGEKALRGMFSSMQESGGTWSEVMKDAAQQSGSTMDKLTSSWETMGQNLGDALEPAIATLAENMDVVEAALSPLVAQVSEVVDVFGQLAGQLRSWGILDPKPEERTKTQGSAREALANDQSRLEALDKLEKTHGLTSKQKNERRKLRDSVTENKQWLAENGFDSKTVDEALTSFAQPKPATRGATAADRERAMIEGSWGSGETEFDRVLNATSGQGYTVEEAEAEKGDTWRSSQRLGPPGVPVDLLRAALGGDPEKAQNKLQDLSKVIASIEAAAKAQAEAAQKAGAAADAQRAAATSGGNRVPGDPPGVQ